MFMTNINKNIVYHIFLIIPVNQNTQTWNVYKIIHRELRVQLFTSTKLPILGKLRGGRQI